MHMGALSSDDLRLFLTALPETHTHTDTHTDTDTDTDTDTHTHTLTVLYCGLLPAAFKQRRGVN